MFGEAIDKRIALLDANLFIVSENQMILDEAQPEGRSELNIRLVNPTIAFKKLKDKRLKYFICQKSADHILFQMRDDGWVLHIIEMKKTVTSSKWYTEIKEQFKGAILNGYSISGFLGIQLKEIFCHTAFREDKIQPSKLADIIEFKRPLGEKHFTAFDEWDGAFALIELDEIKKIKHTKIQLSNINGTGVIEI